MSQAARVTDPVEHTGSLTGLLAGLAIGAIGGASIGSTNGLAAAVMVGASVAAGSAIEALSASLSASDHMAGQISSGSRNVHINGRAAARAHLDTAKCDKHSSKLRVIAQGSSSVYINSMPAARAGDRIACDAKISAGSANVFIGG